MFALPTACQTTKSMDFSSQQHSVCASGTFQGAPWPTVVLQLLAEPLVLTDFEEWWIWWYGPTHSLRKKFLLQEVQASWPFYLFFPQISPTFICCMCCGSMTTRVIFKNTFNWLEWMPNKSEGAWAIILSHTFLQYQACMHDSCSETGIASKVYYSQWFLNLWPRTLGGNPKSPWALASVLFKEPSILVGSDTERGREGCTSLCSAPCSCALSL